MGDSAIGSAMQNVAVESGKGMGSATKGAGGEKDKGETEMFRVNQIYYRMIPTLSLVAKRTLLQNYAQKNTYLGTNDTIVFIFNTGEYYVSMSSSYLYMQLGIVDMSGNDVYHSVKALIAQGNAMSLFEEVTFISSSGTEVCRELNKGTFAAFDYHYNNTREYIDTIGQIQGAPTGKYSEIHDGVAPYWQKIFAGADNNGTLEYSFPNLQGVEGTLKPFSGGAARVQWGQSCVNLNKYSQPNNAAGAFGNNYHNPQANYVEVVIPMDQVLGLFKPYMNALFPAALLAGSRLEFRLKNLSESLQMIAGGVMNDQNVNQQGVHPNTQLNALVTAGNNPFVINRIYLTLDAFQLGENVLKRLNEVSAGEDGLSMLFNTYDHVLTNASAAGTQEVMVSQARSRIIRSWNVVRNNLFLTNPYINSFAAECAEVNRICAKVPPGSIQIPNVTVVSGTIPPGTTTGWGGGLSYLMMNANANNSTTVVQNSVDTILPIQPKLPSDSCLARMPTVSSYQAQLGSLFFPQQPITTNPEHYQNALYVMCKSIPDKDNNCSVSYEDFLGGQGAYLYPGMYPNPAIGPPAGPNVQAPFSSTPIDPTTDLAHGSWVAPYGLAIYGMLAEKSQALQLSGLPISNARLLKHKFVFSSAPAIGTVRTINTFTEYTRVCKVFMGGRVIVRE